MKLREMAVALQEGMLEFIQDNESDISLLAMHGHAAAMHAQQRKFTPCTFSSCLCTSLFGHLSGPSHILVGGSVFTCSLQLASILIL